MAPKRHNHDGPIMGEKTEALVRQQWRELLRECEGREDALQYIGAIASDLRLDAEEVYEYIKTL